MLGSVAFARPFALEDLDRVRDVGAPTASADGLTVVYAVTETRVEEDDSESSLVRVGPGGARALTEGPSDHTPRLSPDGRTLAFLRPTGPDALVDQIWLLPMDGGEAKRLTEAPGGVSDLVWSPDGQRLAAIVGDPPVTEDGPRPIVVDRWWFLSDDEGGFLTHEHRHLTLVDAATGELTPLVTGDTDEDLPAFSPDGARVAFVSRRGPDPDREDFDVYVVGVAPGSPIVAATQNPTADCDPEFESRPAWSPDGRWLAVASQGAAELSYFARYEVAVVPADGSGPGRRLAPALDRNSWAPVFSRDGRTLTFLVEDDGSVGVARAPAAGGKVERLTPPELVVWGLEPAGDGHLLLAEDATHPAELHALDKRGRTRPLTTENAAWLAELDLAPVARLAWPSADGTEIHGFVATPAGAGPFPTYLRLHGGPVWQVDWGFRAEVQLLVAHGYAVVMPNPRGSTGRGEAFSHALFADWGHLDTEDVLGAVDHLVAKGVADPARLAVGGWSYGGILTDQVIARDGRFKAAISGAGIANVVAGYGTDQYVRDYEAELGRPWEHPDVWAKVSYPFLHADRIHTPTLFLHGAADVNVPLHGSQQMYQALRTLGVPTELVVYPDEPHGIGLPSFARDVERRHVEWLDRWLTAPGR